MMFARVTGIQTENTLEGLMEKSGVAMPKDEVEKTLYNDAVFLVSCAIEKVAKQLGK